jgi:ABC-2 type transport system permease protein
MVAQLLRLRVQLLANAFRRSVWQVIGLSLAIVYGAFVTVIALAALISARFIGDVGLTRDIVVIVGSLVVLAFIVLPLVMGIDDTLDPRKFSLFGVPTPRLALGLAVAALVGVPAVVLTISSLATIVTWSRNPGSTIVAILSAIIAVPTCVLAARVSASIAAALLDTRRSREFSGVVGLLIVVVLTPTVLLLANMDWSGNALGVLRGIANAVGWTPLGAVWSAPADAALGETGAPLLKLLIAIAFLGALWLAWRALVNRLLVTPGRQAQAKEHAGIGWFAVMPGRPIGVIAARSLTYWGRDARYWTSLLLVPIFPAIMIVALFVVGVHGSYVALIPLPVMCLFLGWTIHNDVAYDATAIWLHIASGTRGLGDRIGRLIPVLLIGIPVIAIGTVLSVIAYGDWVVAPAVVGLSGGILLIGVGLSSFSSAMFPYPATKPGDSPFTQPQNTGALAAVVQSLSFLLILLFAAPAIAFTVFGVLGDPGLFTAALFSGLGAGIVILVVGVLAGSAAFNRRGPEIMASAVRAD